MHIERFGTDDTEGIDQGECFVFPKIDGTNSSLWWEAGNPSRLCAGSRNRELSLDNDNGGFFNWCVSQPQGEMFARFFRENPNVRLFGEFLIPHSLKTYREDAWGKFYVFDVMVDYSYLSYDLYQPLLEEYGIEYIPPVCKIKNPTYERLIEQMMKSSYLIEDGKGAGEGIVIKRYDFKNKYGRTVWAKIVSNEFKAKHQKTSVGEIKEKKMVEEEIVKKYITKSLVDKEHSKIEGWSSKQIPRLLNTVFHCLVTEETWNFIKDHKNPTIDFRRLYYLTTIRIKELMPELF